MPADPKDYDVHFATKSLLQIMTHAQNTLHNHSLKGKFTKF